MITGNPKMRLPRNIWFMDDNKRNSEKYENRNAGWMSFPNLVNNFTTDVNCFLDSSLPDQRSRVHALVCLSVCQLSHSFTVDIWTKKITEAFLFNFLVNLTSEGEFSFLAIFRLCNVNNIWISELLRGRQWAVLVTKVDSTFPWDVLVFLY